MRLSRSFAKHSGVIPLVGLIFLCIQLEAAQKYSSWSAPRNLGPVVNSPWDESLSSISKDELSLFFASTRPGTGNDDIWVSQRTSKNAPWGAPQNLGAINTPFRERTPTLSRDEHYMFFVTDRPGGFGQLDIWVSWREHTKNDFGWQPPVNLGSGVNSSFNDVGPTFFQEEDGQGVALYFSSNRPGGIGAFDIYYSALASTGMFGAAVLIPELSSPVTELKPAIRNDGLEMFFSSDRMGTIGEGDLWVSTRNTISDRWSVPVNLGPGVNTEFFENFPTLTSDGQTLLFVSDRPDFQQLDLYEITRAKK